MTPSEAAELILKWAGSRTEPFMTSDAHREIKEIEDVKAVSDGLRYLFLKNLVTRQQAAGGKFLYSMAAKDCVEKHDVEIVEEKQEIINGEDEMKANKVEETADQIQVNNDYDKNQAGIQPLSVIESLMPPDQFKGFLRGSVINHIARCDKKGGSEDLEKARHYLDKLIEACANT